jgi:hypothetical protein
MRLVYTADRQQPRSYEARESLTLLSKEPKFAESAHSLAGGFISHPQVWTCVRILCL